MQKRCQYIATCPMFRRFATSGRTMYQAYQCESSYTECARYQQRLEGKKKIIATLTPQGIDLAAGS